MRNCLLIILLMLSSFLSFAGPTGACDKNLEDIIMFDELRIQMKPTLTYASEAVSIRVKDKALRKWFDVAKEKFKYIDDPIILLYELNQYVSDTMAKDLSNEGWKKNPIAKLAYHFLTKESFSNTSMNTAFGDYDLGSMLKFQCGVCRHKSVALNVLLRLYGYESYFMTGSVKIMPNGTKYDVFDMDYINGWGGHAWVEVRLNDQYFLLDPQNGPLTLEEGTVKYLGKYREIQLNDKDQAVFRLYNDGSKEAIEEQQINHGFFFNQRTSISIN